MLGTMGRAFSERLVLLGWRAGTAVEKFTSGNKDSQHLLSTFYIYQGPCCAFFFFLSMSTPAAYGRSQARGQIGAAAAGLRYSHSITGSEPHLGSTPQLTAIPDP